MPARDVTRLVVPALCACALLGPASVRGGDVARSSSAAVPNGTVLRIPESIPVRRESERATQVAGARPLVAAGILAIVALVALGASRQRRRLTSGRAAPGWRHWFMRPSASESVRLVDSIRLTPRTSVHVLRWAGREWLVGSGDAGVNVIAERPEPKGQMDGPVMASNPTGGEPT